MKTLSAGLQKGLSDFAGRFLILSRIHNTKGISGSDYELETGISKHRWVVREV